ncbi:hypothetical protein B4Q13_24520 [Lacticaseibacillus rhamnosus]
MSRCAYVNGRYLPLHQAAVNVEDRGYQFADGVYEVCEVRDGRLIDERRHMDRLVRSLGELRIAMPMSRAALGATGKAFTESSIGAALAQRELMEHLRSFGESGGGPKPFSAADRSRILSALDAAVMKAKRG